MFWMGEPPTRPGMPVRHSIPAIPCWQRFRTSAFQSVPAETLASMVDAVRVSSMDSGRSILRMRPG